MKKDLSQTGSHSMRATLSVCGFAIKAILAFGLITTQANAFSLLGPYTDWMQTTNGYRWLGDIGGPMDIDEEYRWNVPIVTYAFDKSFLDYFGAKGVAAVRSAIQVLNNLPPASRIVLTNYPFDSRQINSTASSQNLYDLKSATLALLLEQMGLGKPSRNVFAIRRWDKSFFDLYPDEASWPEGTIPYYVIERNFDPATLAPSHYVNNVLYTGLVHFFPITYGGSTNVHDIVEIPIDPVSNYGSAVEDENANNLYIPLQPGHYFTGLTRDDVGGLRYLLQKTNVNYEMLLPDVFRLRSLAAPDVNGAWRPGVEKITFVPYPYDTIVRRPVRRGIRYSDAYIVNGVVMRQEVRRIITQPDFLFCAADTGENNWWSPWTVVSGTTNWINNAALNGAPTNAGPGVVQPPIKIIFYKLGATIYTGDNIEFEVDQSWGSFNDPTNLPIIYPSGKQHGHADLSVRLHFHESSTASQLVNQVWHLPIPIGGQAVLQISTNQVDWTSLVTVTNRGAVIEWDHYSPANPQKYFRVLPQ